MTLGKFKKNKQASKMSSTANDVSSVEKKEMSVGYQNYLRSIKVEKIKVLIMQLVLLVAILVLWEVLANKGVISTFLFSKPSEIYDLFMRYMENGSLPESEILTFFRVRSPSSNILRNQNTAPWNMRPHPATPTALRYC